MLAGGLLIGLASAEAHALEIFNQDYWNNYLTVTGQAVSRPFDTSDSAVRGTALFSSSLAASLILDKSVRNLVQDARTDTTDDISHFLYRFGRQDGMYPAIGTSYGVAVLTGNTRLERTTLLAVQSGLITLGLTAGLKLAFNRSRPRDSGEPGDFWSGGKAMPSSHVSGAWALATVYAGVYRNPLIQTGLYGYAGAMALARMNADGHWVSDTVAGGFIGYGIGRLTLAADPFDMFDAEPGTSAAGASGDMASGPGWLVAPLHRRDAQGLALHTRF